MKSDELPIDFGGTNLNLDDEFDHNLIAEAEAVVAGCDKRLDPRQPWEIQLDEILAGSDIPVEDTIPSQKTAESEYDRGFFDGIKFAQKTPEFRSLDLTESHAKGETEDIFKLLEDIINKLPTPENGRLDNLNPQVKFCRFGDTIVIFDSDCGTEPIYVAIQFTQSKPGGIPRLVPTCSSIEEIHFLKSRDSEGREIEIGHNSNSLCMDRETGQLIFHTTSPDARLYGPERAEFLYMLIQRELGIFRKLLEKKS